MYFGSKHSAVMEHSVQKTEKIKLREKAKIQICQPFFSGTIAREQGRNSGGNDRSFRYIGNGERFLLLTFKPLQPEKPFD